MRRFLVAGVAAAAMMAVGLGTAKADLITFEEFAPGAAVGTVGNATFSAPGTSIIWAFGGLYAQSGVNTIASATSFNDDLYVDFATAVNGLSFYSGGDDFNGVQALINVFVGGVFSQTVNLVGDGDAGTTDFQDLSAIANITRIEIVSVTDPAGLVYDDFAFTTDGHVPEPATLALFGLGLAGLGVTRRRKSA